FASGIKNVPPETLLRSAGDITRQLMPSQGVNIVESTTLLSEIQGGWVRLAPTLEPPPHVFSELVTDDQAVLVFGAVQHGYDETSAQVVARTWQTQGVTAVRGLEGSFSAVLVDRRTAQTVLVSDLVGLRTLRYLSDQESFFVSPHDLPIVATGRCPLTFNLEASQAVMICGRSLTNRNLLKSITNCSPASTVTFRSGQIQHIDKPIIDLSDRIAAGDRRACTAHLDHMLEGMRDNARSIIRDQPEAQTDLTAGADSRAAFSLLLSVTEPSRIHAFCRGEEQSWEVQVARRLAEHYGVKFSTVVPEPDTVASEENFITHCDLRAFHMNGDTDAKRAAIGWVPTYDPNPIRRASGRNGEFFRGGVYASRSIQLTYGPNISFEQANQINIRRRDKQFQSLPWLDPPSVWSSLEDRLTRTLEKYANFSDNLYDSLYLFQLNESHGPCGSMVVRFPWMQKYWSPYYSPHLIRMAFRFPPPISAHCLVHNTLIRRYMPRGYWTRVNQKDLLPLEGPGIAKKLLRKADSKLLQASRRTKRLRHVPAPTLATKTPHQLSSEALAGPLAGAVHEIVQRDGGFGDQLFGAAGLEGLLDEHRTGQHNHVGALGMLITMERWRTMIEKAYHLASAPVA
ncbi:MAG: hypothetical protein ACE5Q6_08530, partial [Dehalococcoidia bacterium]